jgi:hypothetical protein
MEEKRQAANTKNNWCQNENGDEWYYLFIHFYLLIIRYNAALICRTTTAFYPRKPPILYEEPTAREPKVFANADGHDLARC